MLRRARVVAKLDATTLGNIDVQCPDAVAFLNRMYTNARRPATPRPVLAWMKEWRRVAKVELLT